MHSIPAASNLNISFSKMFNGGCKLLMLAKPKKECYQTEQISDSAIAAGCLPKMHLQKLMV